MNLSSFSKQSGVTLLELVLVIVTVGILTAPIAAGFKTLGQGFGLNRELQMASSYAQECAEHVLQLARNGSVASITPTICEDDLPAIPALQEFSTITRSMTMPDLTGGACPAGETCLDVTVTAMANGNTRSEIRLLLVK